MIIKDVEEGNAFDCPCPYCKEAVTHRRGEAETCAGKGYEHWCSKCGLDLAEGGYPLDWPYDFSGPIPVLKTGRVEYPAVHPLTSR